MARSSLGTDIFSPVRFDLSFDENIINAEVNTNRSSISEKLRRPSTQRLIENIKSVASLEKDSRRKIDSLSEETGLKRTKNSNQNGNIAIEAVTTKCQSPLSNSRKILNSPDKEINKPSTSKNGEVLKKSRSRRNKDGKSDQEIKKKDKNSLSNSSRSAHSSSTKNTSIDVISSKFVTVRRESKKNSFADSVDILPVHSERNEEKESITGNLEDCKKPIQPDLSISEKEIASTKTGPIVELNSLNQMKPEETSTVSSNKIQSGNHTTDKTSSSGTPNQSAQVQRNIIEKLISDTVSYEFDGIRRQMYFQQITILKMLNQRMDEFEIQHTNTTQALHEIIADLLEENQKLRNALIARQ